MSRRKLLASTLVLTAAVAGTTAPALAGATRMVSVRDNVFRPSSLTARAGDTVVWRWAGRAPHNVRVSSGPQRFGSRIQTRGSYRRTVRRRGTYRIVCTIHPGMRMTLRVR
jgi:plastocyanin